MNCSIGSKKGKTLRIPPFIAWHFCCAVIHCTTFILHTGVLFVCFVYPHVHLHYVFDFDVPIYWITALSLHSVEQSRCARPHCRLPEFGQNRSKKTVHYPFSWFFMPDTFWNYCCVPYLWQTCTFHIHTQVVDTLFMYLLTLWITCSFTSHLRVLVLK